MIPSCPQPPVTNLPDLFYPPIWLKQKALLQFASNAFISTHLGARYFQTSTAALFVGVFQLLPSKNSIRGTRQPLFAAKVFEALATSCLTIENLQSFGRRRCLSGATRFHLSGWPTGREASAKFGLWVRFFKRPAPLAS
jgi:hypothetical protein